MSKIADIFDRLENIIRKDGQTEFVAAVTSFHMKKDDSKDTTTYTLLRTFLFKIFTAIDELASEILNDDSILISVKNQKTLRTCFQVVTSVGISNCLIPGLGISLTKRCTTSNILPKLTFSDEEKYELLVDCTNFFTRSYKVPVIKNIIVTLHLSDYLAALLQLAFAPLKKPGTYSHFVMTQERYNQLNEHRKQFVMAYEVLVTNCFQPTLMKELLVLQSVNEPSPPAFAKRMIAKEMSRRLLSPGGLLSLIRCFIESYCIDTGFEWKNIDLICRLVSQANHGIPENDYLINISTQLAQILALNNTHYLATAVACVISLNDKYPNSIPIQTISKDIFQAFDYNSLKLKSSLPGTVILSPQEVNHKVNILHACVCSVKLEWPMTLLSPNLYVLFLIGARCSHNEELRIKLKDVLLKCLEKLSKGEVTTLITKVLVDKDNLNSGITIGEYDSGVAVKSAATKEHHSGDEEVMYFLELFNSFTDCSLVKAVFEASLDLLIKFSVQRKNKASKDLLTLEDQPIILDDIDSDYATILQLLSEMSMSPKVVAALKNDPKILMKLIEHSLLKEGPESNEACTSLALVLLNMVLANSTDKQNDFNSLIPVLRRMSKDESNFNHILCKEALSLMDMEVPGQSGQAVTAFGKALTDVFDNLLPVRAHGIMELTKLVDAKDPETISKKHYIFCLFQEQLKDEDSYIYLAAVNGLAALCTHCTEDVLHVLCNEFLQISFKQIETKADIKSAETRMKIGDVIVKVTKRLGEMAVVHKSVLLNTMLSACRDHDALIRTSALSNLAEIALVLNYKIGNIIYEFLLCIWGVIETDKAVECRRAAVMVISSLLKGLGKETLVQLKENLLPIYRTLKNLYRDDSEDSLVRLHAQIALEELNDVVKQFLFPEVEMEKRIFVLDGPGDVFN